MSKVILQYLLYLQTLQLNYIKFNVKKIMYVVYATVFGKLSSIWYPVSRTSPLLLMAKLLMWNMSFFIEHTRIILTRGVNSLSVTTVKVQ